MRSEYVVVDGETKSYRYFEGSDDIALGFCTDSYLLFDRRRKGPSATPILMKNDNLPPDVRTHLDDLICCGVIPGPKNPKDMASFLVPLDDELVQLTHGVRTYNALTRNEFYLRAYNFMGIGDILAIEKVLNIKGHNRGVHGGRLNGRLKPRLKVRLEEYNGFKPGFKHGCSRCRKILGL